MASSANFSVSISTTFVELPEFQTVRLGFFSANIAGTGNLYVRGLSTDSGTDRLNFVRIDADSLTPDDQAFTFIGIAAFIGTGTAQIRYVDTGSAISMFVDINGDANAGPGAGTLTAVDFVL